MSDIDFAALIDPVARKLWGEPNTALSSTKNLRWGTHGSKSVDLGRGVWHDHESNEGGGTLDLVKRETGHADKDAVTWLEGEGFINGHTATSRIAATYNYVDETGAPLFQVCRFTPKDFRQRRPNGAGWIWNLKDTRRVLYQLPALFEAIANNRPVLIVEGEKDCDNLRKLNFTATTNPGGANKWRAEYNEYLRDAAVILVPDNDDVGRAHMEAVAAELNGVAKSIRFLKLPDLPDKGDVSDWLANGGTAENLQQLIEQTPEWKTPATNDLDEFTFDGAETIAPQSMLVEDLLPTEGIVFVGGQSGAGKTFLVVLLGTCLASAKPFFGRAVTKPVGVLYIAAEGQSMIAARVAAAKDALELDARQPLPIAWLKSPPKLSTPQDTNRFISRLRTLDKKFRQDHGVCLGAVILDTVAATFDLTDENDNAEAAKACARMRQIVSGFSGVVVPVHHYGKTMESGLRGASAWRAGADIVLAVLAEVDPFTGDMERRELAVTKSRDGVTGAIAPFPLKFISLDADKEFGTCCVVPDLKGEIRFGVKKGRATRSALALRDAITEAMDSCGQNITLRNTGPIVRAVAINYVRAEFDRRYVIDQPDARKQTHAKLVAFNRALEKLPLGFGMGAQEGIQWIWRTV